MSIANTIIKYFYTYMKKNSETSSSTQVKNISKNTGIIQQTEVPENVDSFQHEENTTNNSSTSNRYQNENIGQIKKCIEMQCRKYNLDYNAICKAFDFENIPPEKMKEACEYLRESIDYYSQNVKFERRANRENMIVTSSKQAEEAITNGYFEDYKDYTSTCGNSNQNFDNIEKTHPKNSKLDNIKLYREQEYARYKKELNDALKDVSPEQREETIARIEARHRYIQREHYIALASSLPPEDIVNGMVVLNAEDLDFGMRTALNSRQTSEERMALADNTTFEAMSKVAEVYNEYGEKITATSWANTTSTVVREKSTDGVRQYQQDYEKARDDYENGQNRPDYLSEEIFTATATGIGTGALLNENMTTSEKKEFIQTWAETAKKYNDYSTVINKLAEFAENYPDIKDEIKNQIKTITEEAKVAQEAQTDDCENQSTNNKTSKASGQSNISVTYASNPLTIEKSTKTTETASNTKTKSKNDNIAIISRNTTSPVKNEVVQYLTKHGIDSDATKKYSNKDIVEAVLQAPYLSYLRPQITQYLNTMEVQELVGLTQGKTSTFLFLLEHLNEDKAVELYESCDDLCYASKKLGENIVNQKKERNGEKQGLK